MDVVGGNRGYSGFMREALDPDARRGPERGVQHRPRACARRSRTARRRAVPRAQRLAEDAGISRDAARLFRRLPGARPRLHRAFARDLGLPLDFFADKLDASAGDAAAAALSRPSPPARSAPATHTDYGNITLLATDGVGGLEVRTRAGDWLAAPSIAGAFVVNIGDCLMRWTNDVYVSTPHRVVSRGVGERYSIAFFLDPNPFATSRRSRPASRPASPKYPPILAHDYLRSRFEATYLPEG